MIFLVPIGFGVAQATQVFEGQLVDKLRKIFSDMKEDINIEVDDEEYGLIRPILKSVGIEYKIIVDVPDIPTPRSFLYEDDIDVIVSFSELVKGKPTSAEDRALNDLIGDGDATEDRDNT